MRAPRGAHPARPEGPEDFHWPCSGHCWPLGGHCLVSSRPVEDRSKVDESPAEGLQKASLQSCCTAVKQGGLAARGGRPQGAIHGRGRASRTQLAIRLRQSAQPVRAVTRSRPAGASRLLEVHPPRAASWWRQMLPAPEKHWGSAGASPGQCGARRLAGRRRELEIGPGKTARDARRSDCRGLTGPA